MAADYKNLKITFKGGTESIYKVTLDVSITEILTTMIQFITYDGEKVIINKEDISKIEESAVDIPEE